MDIKELSNVYSLNVYTSCDPISPVRLTVNGCPLDLGYPSSLTDFNEVDFLNKHVIFPDDLNLNEFPRIGCDTFLF